MTSLSPLFGPGTSSPWEGPTRLPRPLALLALGWVAASGIYGSHLYLFHVLRGSPTSLWLQLAEASLHLGIWGALTPLVFRLAAKRPLSRSTFLGWLGFHLAIAAPLALLQVVLHAALDQRLLHGMALSLPSLANRVVRLFTRTFYANVLLYMTLVLAFEAVQLFRRRRAGAPEREETEREEPEPASAALRAEKAVLSYLDFVTVHSDGRLRLVPVREIDCFVAEGNYVEVSVRDASYRIRGSLREVESRVDPRRFFRTHRSAIVNLAAVAEIRPAFGDRDEVVLRTGRRLPLSRRQRNRLPELL